MGSLEGRAVLQLEDENHVDSKHNDRRTSSMDATPQISVFNADTDDISCKCMWNNILRQMHIVLFSKKLNLLIPCGPLAMLVDTLTDHHVSCKLSPVWYLIFLKELNYSHYLSLVLFCHDFFRDGSFFLAC